MHCTEAALRATAHLQWCCCMILLRSATVYQSWQQLSSLTLQHHTAALHSILEAAQLQTVAMHTCNAPHQCEQLMINVCAYAGFLILLHLLASLQEQWQPKGAPPLLTYSRSGLVDVALDYSCSHLAAALLSSHCAVCWV